MLLDTSGLLCCYHGGEPQHIDAVTFFCAAPTRITHNYVLAEFVPLCHSRGMRRTGVLTFVVDLLDSPDVEVIWVNEPLHRAAVSFLQSRLDKCTANTDVRIPYATRGTSAFR